MWMVSYWYGNIVAGLENEMIGMKIGDSKDI